MSFWVDMARVSDALSGVQECDERAISAVDEHLVLQLFGDYKFVSLRACYMGDYLSIVGGAIASWSTTVKFAPVSNFMCSPGLEIVAVAATS